MGSHCPKAQEQLSRDHAGLQTFWLYWLLRQPVAQFRPCRPSKPSATIAAGAAGRQRWLKVQAEQQPKLVHEVIECQFLRGEGSLMQAHLQLFMRLPHSFAVCLLPPIMPIFPEEAHSPPIEQEQRTPCSQTSGA